MVSVDGKISTGDTDVMDVDKDFPKMIGVKEGLKQYYDLERKTDFFSLITGRVLAKVGINDHSDEPKKSVVRFVVIDNKPHLTKAGVSYLAKKSKSLIIVTTNNRHPASTLQKDFPQLHVLKYQRTIDFRDLFLKLKKRFGAKRLTIQSGGTLNTLLVRQGLVDRVLLVVAPALIGGKNTATLMDGESLHTPKELSKIKALKLTSVKRLKHSYLLLEYRVKN